LGIFGVAALLRSAEFLGKMNTLRFTEARLQQEVNYCRASASLAVVTEAATGAVALQFIVTGISLFALDVSAFPFQSPGNVERNAMKRLRTFVLSICIVCSAMIFAQEVKPIQLPPPQTEIGKPLMQALKLRQSARSFDSKPLSLQELSNLLWAANGVNRTESGKRTAPTARNWQEIDVYVALPEALYLYEARTHSLKPVLAKDLREATGSQGFVKDAPVNLVYVADFAKMGNASEDDKNRYSGTDTGFVSQNVYLYCASQGLVTVVRGMVDRSSLSKVMQLRPDQKIILAQTVGYPK
jgi:SagB-type dehydrogenase family enzyme